MTFDSTAGPGNPVSYSLEGGGVFKRGNKEDFLLAGSKSVHQGQVIFLGFEFCQQDIITERVRTHFFPPIDCFSQVLNETDLHHVSEIFIHFLLGI